MAGGAGLTGCDFIPNGAVAVLCTNEQPDEHGRHDGQELSAGE